MPIDIHTPSASAILIPTNAQPSRWTRVEAALSAHGYAPLPGRAPGWYAAHHREIIELVCREHPQSPWRIFSPDEPAEVFVIATAIAKSVAQPMAAWRRFMGGAPVLKFYQEQPLWRDGADTDAELGWSLPTEPPLNGFAPAEHGLPDSAAEAGHQLASILATPPADRRSWALAGSDLHDL